MFWMSSTQNREMPDEQSHVIWVRPNGGAKYYPKCLFLFMCMHVCSHLFAMHFHNRSWHCVCACILHLFLIHMHAAAESSSESFHALALQANFTAITEHRPHAGSPCLAPFISVMAPVNAHTPPPLLVIVVLVVTLPLANVPSIRLLARLNTIGGACSSNPTLCDVF